MDDQKKLSLIQLSGKIGKSSWPNFECPSCNNNSQKLTNLNSSESRESLAAHNEDWWDPEMIEGSFVAISTCQTCKQQVYIAGRYGVNEYVDDEDGEPHLAYEEEYSIEFMTPAIPLLRVPANCPDEVKQYIASAAQVIFVSPDLAANRIRASIDLLLTGQKIPRTKLSNGKKVKLSTHKRIKLYAVKNPDVSRLLEAVKWIGNEGTHSSSLSMNDLLEGLQIYSLALDLLYDKSTVLIRKRAAAINKNRGIKKISSSTNI